MRHFIQLIKKIQTQDIKAIAPKKSVCDGFIDHADLFLKRTAWASGCRSWFKQGKEDGPLAIWPGSRLLYFKLLAQPRYEDYDIEYRGGNPFGFLGNGFTTQEYDGSDLSYYLGTKDALGALIPTEAPSAPERTSQTLIEGNGIHVDGTQVNGHSPV